MPAPFHNVQFPPQVSYGAVGGPGFRTTVYTKASGYEERNVEWSLSRAEYDVAQTIKTQTEMDLVKNFFLARMGKAYGFRYKDWADYRSISSTVVPAASDTGLGSPASGTTIIQLKKIYADAVNPYTRNITRPVLGSVKLQQAGVVKTEFTDFFVDYGSGRVCLKASLPNSTLWKGGFEFDVPCRFDTDKMMNSLEDYNVNTWGQITLVEIKEVPPATDPLENTALQSALALTGGSQVSALQAVNTTYGVNWGSVS